MELASVNIVAATVLRATNCIEISQITPYHSKFVVRRAPSATLGKNAVNG